MNIKKISLLVIVLGLVVTQFMVDKSNVSSYESVMTFEKDVQLPENVKTIFKSHCYDCHSDHTEYPWYASIGVASLVLAHHIEEGKEHLDFSSWNHYSKKKQWHKLEEVYEEVEEGEMPLKAYTWTHGGLNIEEKETLLNWAKKYKD